MDLILEGIGDIIEGVRGMVTGVFSWLQWAIAKAISIAISVCSFGFGKFCKWMKGGSTAIKKAGEVIVTEGASLSLKQAFKFTAKSAAVQGAMFVAGEVFDVASKAALKKIFESKKQQLKEHISNHKGLRQVIVATFHASLPDEVKNENLIHNHAMEMGKKYEASVDMMLQECMNDSIFMNKFSGIVKQWSGPVMSLLSKTALKKNEKLGAKVQLAVTATTTTIGIAAAIVAYKELQTLIDEAEEKIEKRLKSQFNLNADHYLKVDSVIDKFAKHEQEKIGTQVADFIWERLVDTTTGLLSTIVKTWVYSKATKKLDKIANIDKQRGYFAEKRLAHKNFHVDKSDISARKRSQLVDVDDIIDNKKYQDSDSTDIRAAAEGTNKNIVIHTYDEKTGKLIKKDRTRATNGKEDIHVKLTKYKNEDSTYSGHYEPIDEKGNVMTNTTGAGNTCFWQAIIHTQTGSTLAQDAQSFQRSCFQGMDPHVLNDMHKRQQIYNGTSKGGIFSLDGGVQHKTLEERQRAIFKQLKESGADKNDKEAFKRAAVKVMEEEVYVEDHNAYNAAKKDARAVGGPLRTERCCPGPGGTETRCPADFNVGWNNNSHSKEDVKNRFQNHHSNYSKCKKAYEAGAQPFTNEYFKTQTTYDGVENQQGDKRSNVVLIQHHDGNHPNFPTPQGSAGHFHVREANEVRDVY